MEAGPHETVPGGRYHTGPDPAGTRSRGDDLTLGDGPTDDGELTPDGPDSDGPDAADHRGGHGGPGTDAEVEVELRPQRRLRVWQLAPIVVLTAIGSLMFAFPLAFEFGDSGAVVAMLGLLICACAAGWSVLAARRVGSTWPGLPPPGSGRRPDWRVIVAYAVVVAGVVALAVWRVARLR